MTGAGAVSVAWTAESSFLGGVGGTPTWRQPGMDLDPGEPSLDRQLNRTRHPDSPRSQGSREGNVQGSFDVSFSLSRENFYDLIFNESTNTELPSSSSSTAPSAVWYVSAEAIDATQDRFLLGSGIESATWNYQQGEPLTVDLSIIYADEAEAGDADAPSTPASIDQPAKDDIAMWHDADWLLNTVSVADLQSWSLSISGLYRFIYGQDDIANHLVTDLQEISLTTDAVLNDDRQRELGYGGSGATSLEAEVDQTDSTFTIAESGISDLNVDGIQPTNYSWSELTGESDVTESPEYHVQNVSVA